MTAIVGGLWDSLLGEGRRFWIVAGSDSHFHYTDPVRPGSDFWPGEFHKTYVLARPTYEDVLDGLRSGRIFAAAGGLITTLDVTVDDGTREAGIGGTLAVGTDSSIAVTIQFTDPDEANAGGDDPAVQRVDLIVGEVRGPAADPDLDRNLTTQVIEHRLLCLFNNCLASLRVTVKSRQRSEGTLRLMRKDRCMDGRCVCVYFH